MERGPINYIVQIQDGYLSEFISYWLYCDKPLSLLFVKPKSEGLTAIKLIVKNADQADFLLMAKNKTRCKLYIIQ